MISASQKQSEQEKRLIKARLEGWNKENSPAYLYLKQRFQNVNKIFLIALAKVLSSENGIHLDREAQRHKDVCLKWYDENFSILKPFLQSNICVLDYNNHQMGKETPESVQIKEMYMKQLSSIQNQPEDDSDHTD